MEFTIKDEYTDLSKLDLRVVDREIKAGNPFAVLAKVLIHIGRFNQEIAFGHVEALKTIEAFDWKSHPATIACYAFVWFANSEKDANASQRVKEIITSQDADAIFEKIDNSYYFDLFSGILMARGWGVPKNLELAKEILELTLTAPVEGEQIYEIRGDETACNELETVIKNLVAENPKKYAAVADNLHYQSSLFLIAAANGGNYLAQIYAGLYFLSPLPNWPFFPNIEDRAERQKHAEHYFLLARDQVDDDVNYYLSKVYEETDRPELAERALCKVIGMHPNAPGDLVALLKGQGRAEEAKEILRGELAGNNSNIAASVALANLHDDLGEYPQAFELYRRLLAENQAIPKPAALRVLKYQTGERIPGMPLDEATALSTASSLITLKSRGQLTLTPDEGIFVVAAYDSLCSRAFVNDAKAGGLRRLQQGEQPPPYGSFIVLPQEPQQLSAAVEAQIALGIRVPRQLALELEELTQDFPVLLRRWRTKAGETGLSQKMGEAIEMYFDGAPGLEPDWLEAFRLCGLALQEQRRGGVPRGGIRNTISGIYDQILDQGPGSRPRLWVEARGGPRPAAKNDKIDSIITVPADADQALVFYLDAAEKGSNIARRVAAEIYLNDRNEPDKVRIPDADGSLVPAVEDSDLTQAVFGDFAPPAAPVELPGGASADATPAERATDVPRPEIPLEILQFGETFPAELPDDIEAALTIEPEASVIAAIDPGFSDNALTEARQLAADGQHLESFLAYVRVHNEASLEIAERFAKIKEGAAKNLIESAMIYERLSEVFAYNPDHLPVDAGPRIAALRETILEESWIVTDGIFRKARNGVEGNIEVDDDERLYMFAPTSAGFDNLFGYLGNSQDIDAEIALRLAEGTEDRAPDLLRAFHMASDLILDREIFSQQDPESLEPLPIDSPKRKELQELWDRIALQIETTGPNGDGHQEYFTPGFPTEAPPFFVLKDSAETFKRLRDEGRERALAKAQHG